MKLPEDFDLKIYKQLMKLGDNPMQKMFENYKQGDVDPLTMQMMQGKFPMTSHMALTAMALADSTDPESHEHGLYSGMVLLIHAIQCVVEAEELEDGLRD